MKGNVGRGFVGRSCKLIYFLLLPLYRTRSQLTTSQLATVSVLHFQLLSNELPPKMSLVPSEVIWTLPLFLLIPSRFRTISFFYNYNYRHSTCNDATPRHHNASISSTLLRLCSQNHIPPPTLFHLYYKTSHSLTIQATDVTRHLENKKLCELNQSCSQEESIGKFFF